MHLVSLSVFPRHGILRFFAHCESHCGLYSPHARSPRLSSQSRCSGGRRHRCCMGVDCCAQPLGAAHRRPLHAAPLLARDRHGSFEGRENLSTLRVVLARAAKRLSRRWPTQRQAQERRPERFSVAVRGARLSGADEDKRRNVWRLHQRCRKPARLPPP